MAGAELPAPHRAGAVRARAGLQAVLDRIESPAAARWFERAAWPVALVVLVAVGRRHWFAADDWAFLLTRDRIRDDRGLWAFLMIPQDGHWMVWPLIAFRWMRGLFGLGSYWPYLVMLWATHFGVVALVRVWLHRLGVSPWTAALTTAVLLMFGAGWENLMFAVQIVYNVSLLAFLGQTLLVDHDGDPDGRDWIGAGLGVVNVSSSGFGVFFGFGVGVLLGLRRRWRAAVIAVAPQALALAWWWWRWGDDPAGDAGVAGPRFVFDYARLGVSSTLASMTATTMLGWSAVVLCAAMLAWQRVPFRSRTAMIALAATAVIAFAGIGARREALGVGAAASSRYQYVAAMLLAPLLALGLDQARRFAPWARWLPRALLLAALARNVSWMQTQSQPWADRSAADRHLFALVAGAGPLPPELQTRSISPNSADVLVLDLPALVADGAIEPTQPTTDADRALLAEFLAG